MNRLGGANCPFCRYYNPLDAHRCGRCERRLPPPFIGRLLVRVGGLDLWATKGLALTSIFVFALEMAAGRGSSTGLLAGLRPSVLLRFGAIENGLLGPEPWRLLAACFVHVNVLHVIMNMLALAELGKTGEPILRGPRFLIAYVVTGVVGFLASAWWYGPAPYLTAGASGAIFGLDGILIGDRLARKDPAWREMLVRTIVHSFLFYFALRGMTNQAAHVGGLLAGLALGLSFARESRPWRVAWLINAAAALSMLAALVSLVLPHLSPVWERRAQYERVRDAAREGISPPDF